VLFALFCIACISVNAIFASEPASNTAKSNIPKYGVIINDKDGIPETKLRRHAHRGSHRSSSRSNHVQDVLSDLWAPYTPSDEDYSAMLKKFNFKEFAEGFKLGFNSIMKPVLEVLPHIIAIVAKRDRSRSQAPVNSVMEILQGFQAEQPQFAELIGQHMGEILGHHEDYASMLKKFDFKEFAKGFKQGFEMVMKPVLAALPTIISAIKPALGNRNLSSEDMLMVRGWFDDLKEGLSTMFEPIKESVPHVLEIAKLISALQKSN